MEATLPNSEEKYHDCPKIYNGEEKQIAHIVEELVQKSDQEPADDVIIDEQQLE